MLILIVLIGWHIVSHTLDLAMRIEGLHAMQDAFVITGPMPRSTILECTVCHIMPIPGHGARIGGPCLDCEDGTYRVASPIALPEPSAPALHSDDPFEEWILNGSPAHTFDEWKATQHR